MLKFEGNKARLIRLKLRIGNYTDSSEIFICKGSKISNNTVIDYGSRFNGKIKIKGKGRCLIGKYVAFGDDITIITSNHKTESVNLQYALAHRIGVTPEIGTNKDVNIGHNVWVGDNSIIVPGVSIGNGAIIGAGSVVTKDVAPYAIVAGNPARYIRHRLSEERIAEIEGLAWWDWSIEKMRENRHLFQ